MRRVLLGLSLFFLGCGARTLPDPEPTARAYAAAVRQRDARTVHELLTQSGRENFDVEEVRRLLGEGAKELQQGSSASSPAVRACSAEPEAVVEFDDGSVLRLVRRSGDFKMLSAPGVRSRPLGALAALSELRRALGARDLPALFDLLSSAKREELEKVVADLDRALQDPRSLEAEETLGQFVVRLGDGTRITLVLEDGAYRIAEIQ